MEPDPNPFTPDRIGLTILGICRGIAVVLLALALYVALTNWEGDGGIWALRYFGLALIVFAAGLAIRHFLRDRG